MPDDSDDSDKSDARKYIQGSKYEMMRHFETGKVVRGVDHLHPKCLSSLKSYDSDSTDRDDEVEITELFSQHRQNENQSHFEGQQMEFGHFRVVTDNGDDEIEKEYVLF